MDTLWNLLTSGLSSNPQCPKYQQVFRSNCHQRWGYLRSLSGCYRNKKKPAFEITMINKTGFSSYRVESFFITRESTTDVDFLVIIARFCFLIGRNFPAGTSTASTQTHTRINEVARNVGWMGGSDRRAWEIVPYRRSAQLAGNIYAPTAVEIVYIFHQDRLPQIAWPQLCVWWCKDPYRWHRYFLRDVQCDVLRNI